MLYFVKSFQNLDSFSEYLRTAENNPIFARSMESETGTPKFTGTDSFAEADTLLQYGDPKNANKIKSISAPGDLKNTAKDIRPHRVRSVYGGSVNVAAALTGRPKAMYQIKREPARAKVLNFAYNVSVSWIIKPAEIANAAARLVSAICAIEKRGYRVNLYACKVSEEAHEVEGVFVKIKDSGKHMDPTKMAYPLINPSFNRRHMFKALEKSEVTSSSWAGTYGHCTDNETAKDAARRAGIDLHKVVNFRDIQTKSPADIISLLMN